jgi:phosphoglycerate dehydrogenase-like enzyme
LEDFKKSYPTVEFLTVQSRDDIPALIGDVEIYLGGTSREAFRAAQKPRWIQSYGAGVEWMERVPELIESEVVVTNTRGAHADTMGEHAFALLLTFTRRIRYYDALKARPVWAECLAPASCGGSPRLRDPDSGV